jgi:hypothetical protein
MNLLNHRDDEDRPATGRSQSRSKNRSRNQSQSNDRALPAVIDSAEPEVCRTLVASFAEDFMLEHSHPEHGFGVRRIGMIDVSISSEIVHKEPLPPVQAYGFPS